MPLPKRQHSKTRGRKRRTHWKVTTASMRACPQCAKPVLRIVYVLSAGYYKGTQIVEMAKSK